MAVFPGPQGPEPTMDDLARFCRLNPDCSDHGRRGGANLRVHSRCGARKPYRILECRTCGARSSERKGTPLEDSRLPADKVVSLLDHLREGCGTRATSRLVGVDKNTVTRYLRLAGPHAEALHHELVAFSPPDA